MLVHSHARLTVPVGPLWWHFRFSIAVLQGTEHLQRHSKVHSTHSFGRAPPDTSSCWHICIVFYHPKPWWTSTQSCFIAASRVCMSIGRYVVRHTRGKPHPTPPLCCGWFTEQLVIVWRCHCSGLDAWQAAGRPASARANSAGTSALKCRARRPRTTPTAAVPQLHLLQY